LAFCNKCINFHLVAFRDGCSWVNTARRIGDVPELFHPTSHIAGTHVEMVIDMTKSISDICSGTLLYEHLNHRIVANYTRTSFTAILLQWTADKY
jgi:hypothetical protein